MKRLVVFVLAVGVLVAGAYLYVRRGAAAQAEARRAAALQRHAGGGAPQGPNPAEMSFADLCAWLSREYEGYGSWGTVALDKAEAALARAEQGGEALAIAGALQHLAEIYLIHGRNEEAVAGLERAIDLAEGDGAPDERVDDLVMSLAIAQLRRGEADHCIEMHNPESCLFPLSKGGVWVDTSGALAAIEQLELLLARHPDATSARWLLNLAHMAAGSWPEGVPEEYRLPAEVVSPGGDVGHFSEIAGALGLATFNGAGGAILDDFDNDGLLDLVTSSIFPCEPLRYYRNDGAGGFEERTEAAGLTDQLGGLNCVQADYDGDGWLDVLVLRGAWMGRQYGRQRNSLLRNVEGRRFEDVTAAAGMGHSAFPTQAGTWADYDLDGDLDLYVGNELFPNELFRNEGDGTFTEVAAAAGVDGGRAFTKGAAWGDFDNDGDPDLHVSNWNLNYFFRNEGDGSFTEIGAELGVASHGKTGDEIADAVAVMGEGQPDDEATFGTWFFDYDNDGWLDLYVSGYSANLENIAGDYMGKQLRDPRRLRIYHNTGASGRPGFENLAAALGADDIRLPMGGNFGDVDNDGWLDFYLGTGQPRFEYLLPNVLYRNVEGRAFVDQTIAAGVGHLQKGHGVAFGDLDNDGDQDLFAQMGGFYPADAFQDALFLNPGNDNHWVTLVLAGGRKNTRAVGARIAVEVERPGGAARTIHVVSGSGGSFGASSLQQEIGLGDATAVRQVEVRWPGGQRQVFQDVPLDAFVRLTEGSDAVERLERPVISLAQ